MQKEVDEPSVNQVPFCQRMCIWEFLVVEGWGCAHRSLQTIISCLSSSTTLLLIFLLSDWNFITGEAWNLHGSGALQLYIGGLIKGVSWDIVFIFLVPLMPVTERAEFEAVIFVFEELLRKQLSGKIIHYFMDTKSAV